MSTLDRAEFLATRQSGLGGSDIASVLSVGYGCPLRLYREKTGEPADYPRKDTGPMKLGRILEPAIAQEFAEYSGAEVVEVPVQRDPEHPELLVHADRLLRYLHHSGAQMFDWGVMEIKALGARAFLEMKQSGLVVDYALQLNWGMLLHDKQWGTFVVGNRDTFDLLDWDVYRDDELCQMIRERAIMFWERVKGGIPPARLDPDDRRCQTCQYRRTCQGDALIHLDPKAKIEQDEAMRPLMVEYSERKRVLEEAQEAMEIQKALIKDAMGDRVAVMAGDSKVYFKPQSPIRWNTDKMTAALQRMMGSVNYEGEFQPAAPGVVEKMYKEPGASFRSLRIYE
jgi:predicted phage-related endonuclease